MSTHVPVPMHFTWTGDEQPPGFFNLFLETIRGGGGNLAGIGPHYVRFRTDARAASQ